MSEIPQKYQEKLTIVQTPLKKYLTKYKEPWTKLLLKCMLKENIQITYKTRMKQKIMMKTEHSTTRGICELQYQPYQRCTFNLKSNQHLEMCRSTTLPTFLKKSKSPENFFSHKHD